MKLLWCLLTFAQAFASEAPLSFSARIQDEALAEEAIDLLHCISERKGIPWELGAETAPSPSVRLVEKNGRLEGTFRSDGVREFTLQKNGWRLICDELAPALGAQRTPNAGPFLPTEAPVSESTASGKSKWLIAGMAVAVLAGGFILWRSSRPDHRSIRME